MSMSNSNENSNKDDKNVGEGKHLQDQIDESNKSVEVENRNGSFFLKHQVGDDYVRVLKESQNSDIYAVIREAVSNGYDAKATVVKIEFDPQTRTLTIEDNGTGILDMSAFMTSLTRRKEIEAEIQGIEDTIGRHSAGKMSYLDITKKPIEIVTNNIKGEEYHISMDDIGGQFDPAKYPGEFRKEKGTLLKFKEIDIQEEIVEEFVTKLRERMTAYFALLLLKDENKKLYLNENIRTETDKTTKIEPIRLLFQPETTFGYFIDTNDKRQVVKGRIVRGGNGCLNGYTHYVLVEENELWGSGFTGYYSCNALKATLARDHFEHDINYKRMARVIRTYIKKHFPKDNTELSIQNKKDIEKLELILTDILEDFEVKIDTDESGRIITEIEKRNRKGGHGRLDVKGRDPEYHRTPKNTQQSERRSRVKLDVDKLEGEDKPVKFIPPNRIIFNEFNKEIKYFCLNNEGPIGWGHKIFRVIPYASIGLADMMKVSNPKFKDWTPEEYSNALLKIIASIQEALK